MCIRDSFIWMEEKAEREYKEDTGHSYSTLGWSKRKCAFRHSHTHIICILPHTHCLQSRDSYITVRFTKLDGFCIGAERRGVAHSTARVDNAALFSVDTKPTKLRETTSDQIYSGEINSLCTVPGMMSAANWWLLNGVNNQSIQILMYKNILLRCVFQVEGNSDDFALIFSFAMELMRRS